MGNHLIGAVAIVTLLGAGTIAGTFFAFSNFVMSALARLAPDRGMKAMQSINVTVLNPLFLGVFVGTAVLSLALCLLVVTTSGVAGSGLLIAGGLLYLVGCFLVTGTRNVPLNKALAVKDANSEDGAELWAHYLSRWTFWNHIRTVASLAAAALIAVALSH